MQHSSGSGQTSWAGPAIFVLALLVASFIPAETRADAGDALSATLLPATGGVQGAQLAVHWAGADGAHLSAALQDGERGDPVLLAEQRLAPGVNLLSMPVELAEPMTSAMLHLYVHDSNGVPLEHNVQPMQALRGASGFAWQSQFAGPGVDERVHDLLVWDDGNGPALYVAGEFLTAGDGVVNRVARWDGHAWTPLTGASGTGVGGGFGPRAAALAVYDGALIVAGEFSTAGGLPVSNIARWDGSEWSALGGGVDSWVDALVVYDGALIAGGQFSTAGGVTVNRIARWDGTSWSALTGSSGTGVNSFVHALAVFQDDLYVGGIFFQAGGLTVSNIARWDGSEWLPLTGASGTGTSGGVQDLVVYDGALIASGAFGDAGGITVNRVARWDGSEWSALGGGLGESFNDTVYSLGVFNGDLIAGGNFQQANGQAMNGLARWDGSQWSPLTGVLGSGIQGGFGARVGVLLEFDGMLVLGGDFDTTAGGVGNHLARWDGGQWHTVSGATATGLNDSVQALTLYQGDLIAGGQFANAGGTVVNHVARWDGSSWSALTGISGTGVDAPVHDLAVYDGRLIVGGEFIQAGGVVVNGIASWDGQNWSALYGASGTGVTGPTGTAASATVFSLLAHDDALIVGGDFVRAGGVVANSIARWDGSAWSDLGGGMNVLPAGVNALAEHNGDLVAGGTFFQAGGINVNHIARWDGQAWSALGGGMNDIVFALASYGGDLFAGGYFTQAGGSPANFIARWDGGNWSSVGGGVSGGLISFVGALAEFDGSLIVGGPFTQAGGVTVNHVARWDGTEWTALTGPQGTGTSAVVFVLDHFDSPGWSDRLVAGGGFLLTGGVTNWGVGVYGPRGSLAVMPDPLDFGPVQLGQSHGPLAVTLTNTGADPVAVDSISAADGPFTASGGDCVAPPFVLTSGQACTLGYDFSPNAAGPVSSTITISSDDGPLTFDLRGVGSDSHLHVAPGTLDFGAAVVGETSVPMSATLTNAGGTAINISAISTPAVPFAVIGGSCGTPAFSLAPAESCTLVYTFSPAAAGTATDLIDIDSDATGSPQGITLSGEGLDRTLELQPETLEFGVVQIGAQGVQSITLNNTGAAVVSIHQVSTPAAPFQRANGSCGTAPFSVPPGGTCTLEYRFSPVDTGPFSATVTVTGNASSGPHTFTLQGTGTGPMVALSPAMLDFGAHTAGDHADAQVTVTNTGDSDLQLQAIAPPAAPFEWTGGSCEPPQTLAPAASCTLEVRFAPAAMGVYESSLAVTTDAATSPDTVNMLGIAFDASVHKLVAADGEPFDNFGAGVAMSDDTALVGAPGTSAVYVFVREDGAWSQQAKLVGSDATGFTGFGAAVALSGDTALVGAGSLGVDGNSSQGAAYVFTREAGVWTEQAKLTAADGAAFARLGASVALAGDVALLGAWGTSVEGQNNRGAAYLFVREDGDWNETLRLTASDGAQGDNFGRAVALSGDTALIGANNANVGGNNNQGAAYVFTGHADEWSEQAKLVADDGAGFNNFGAAVALNGDVALVGAPGASIGGDFGRGAAYVFGRQGQLWTQQTKLGADDGASNANFGDALVLRGDRALIGARNASVDGRMGQGAAYLFSVEAGDWVQQEKFIAVDGAANDNLGSAVAMADGIALVGAPGATVAGNSGQGAAYLFLLEAAGKPVMDISPALLDFGQVTVGMSEDRLLTISNAGDTDLVIDDISGLSAPFALSGGSCSPPQTLPSQADCTITVSFAPTAAGVFDGELELISNASTSPDTVSVSGVGSDPGPGPSFVRLEASDGLSNDWFGRSVSLDGDTVLISADGAAIDGNTRQGAAYVFVQEAGGWVEQAKLVANDGGQFQQFGISVSLSGDTALIGGGVNVHGAYTFVREAGVWTQQAKFVAADALPSDNFGIAVALDGDTAVVGASTADVDGNPNQGAAYVFVRSGNEWTEQAKLTASDGEMFNVFGDAVAISGDTIVVGASFHNTGGQENQGAAYVFVRDGDTWTEQAKLTASDGMVNDWFGNAVAVAGDTAVIGANQINLTNQPGVAYVFTRDGGVWSEQAKLAASDAVAGDTFGESVTVDGDVILVGAFFADQMQGATYAYTREQSDWSEHARLAAPDGAPGDQFGKSVDLDGNRAAVGAWTAAVAGNETQGAVYIIELDIEGKLPDRLFQDRFEAPQSP